MVASKHFNSLPVPSESEIGKRYARQGGKPSVIAAYRVIAQNVRRLRETKKWSQAELAERLGTSQPAVSALERGSRIPTLEVLVALAEAFGVAIEYLVRAPAKNQK